LLNTIDCILLFFIPYTETDAGWNSGYVFRRRIVFLNYLKTWLLIDVLANIPYSLFSESMDPIVYIWLMSIKLSRLRKAHAGLKRLVRKLGFGVVTLRFTISVWNLMMMLHIVACLWGAVGHIGLESGIDNWITNANL